MLNKTRKIYHPRIIVTIDFYSKIIWLNGNYLKPGPLFRMDSHQIPRFADFFTRFSIRRLKQVVFS